MAFFKYLWTQMAVQVTTVTNRSQMREFVQFPDRLYKGCPYYVPALHFDVRDTFTPQRNAAYRFCRAQLFIAQKDGKTVGRVAAIVNDHANAAWGRKVVRFGWLDFTDDREVSKALLDAVAEWGRGIGMEEIEGPLGFTDFDPEGMLFEGFDRMVTMFTAYNYRYYPEHLEALGYSRGAVWNEWKIPVTRLPEKMTRLSGIVLERYGLHVFEIGNIKADAQKYAKSLFQLVNEAYGQLYGFSAFSEEQMADYVRRYLSLIDKRLVCVVMDAENRIVAAGFALPSLVWAFQKAKGHLFPLGWWHIIKTLKIKADDALELLFLAVSPEYQGKGLNAVIFDHIFPTVEKLGMKYAESNLELETNGKMQSHWKYFEGVEQHKKRCTYRHNL